MKSKNIHVQGFTLIETIISLAIIALMTAAMLVGFGDNIKNERFTGAVNEFAQVLREAQVKSYTTETGNCVGTSGTVCYWRGVVLEYREGNASSQTDYRMRLLSGQDPAAIPSRSQQRGLERAQVLRSYSLQNAGVWIGNITIGGSSVSSAASIAFLAPDGKSYARNGIVGSFSAAAAPYQETEVVEFILRSSETSLVGRVSYNPVTGEINKVVN